MSDHTESMQHLQLGKFAYSKLFGLRQANFNCCEGCHTSFWASCSSSRHSSSAAVSLLLRADSCAATFSKPSRAVACRQNNA